MQEVYIKTLFDTTWYTGEEYDSDALHVVAMQNQAFGGLRLSQSRWEKGAPENGCQLSKYGLESKIPFACIGHKEVETEGTTFNEELWSATASLAGRSGFAYKCDPSSSTCGFYADFLFENAVLDSSSKAADLAPIKANLERFEKMRNFRWIDRHTKEVQLTTTLYNRNHHLFIQANQILDFDLSGKVTAHLDVTVSGKKDLK